MDISYKFIKLDLYTVFTYLVIRSFDSYCVKFPCSECDFIVSRKDTVSKHVKKRHIGATTDQLELTEGDQVMIYRHGKKYTPPCMQNFES